MNSIEWPLNEPIATEDEHRTATLLFKSDNGWYSGSLELPGGIKCAGLWNSLGQGKEGCADLIPPKPKIRTVTIYYDWDEGQSFNQPMGAYRCIKHTITHPDDVKPITREMLKKIIDEIWNCSLYKEALPSIVALLKEHGIECEGG